MKHFKVTLYGIKGNRTIVQTYYTHAINKADAKTRAIQLCVFEVPNVIIRWEVAERPNSVCPEC